jgi:hypothetical protein
MSRFHCSCGFGADEADEFNDHLLPTITPKDGIGTDGERHVPVDLATPLRWYACWPPADER